MFLGKFGVFTSDAKQERVVFVLIRSIRAIRVLSLH